MTKIELNKKLAELYKIPLKKLTTELVVIGVLRTGTKHGCCNKPLSSGECCGNAVPEMYEYLGQEQELHEINTLLIDDSARMFDLMVKHKVILDFTVVDIGSDKCEYVLARQNGVWGKSALVSYKEHETPQAAALYAIARYLVNLTESK